MNEHQTSHAFPLNGNFQEPEIMGIDGILEVYKRNLRGIYMAGPTFFSSIMDVFTDFAMEGQDLKTYFVLLILIVNQCSCIVNFLIISLKWKR